MEHRGPGWMRKSAEGGGGSEPSSEREALTAGLDSSSSRVWPPDLSLSTSALPKEPKSGVCRRRCPPAWPGWAAASTLGVQSRMCGWERCCTCHLFRSTLPGDGERLSLAPTPVHKNVRAQTNEHRGVGAAGRAFPQAARPSATATPTLKSNANPSLQDVNTRRGGEAGAGSACPSIIRLCCIWPHKATVAAGVEARRSARSGAPAGSNAPSRDALVTASGAGANRHVCASP